MDRALLSCVFVLLAGFPAVAQSTLPDASQPKSAADAASSPQGQQNIAIVRLPSRGGAPSPNSQKTGSPPASSAGGQTNSPKPTVLPSIPASQ